jgi:hypothetical protein
MLLYTSRFQRALHRALRAAVAMHRADILCQLLAAHGVRACAKALSRFPGRVLADALSLLPGDERIRPGPGGGAGLVGAPGGWSHSAAALRRAIATHLPHDVLPLSPDICAGLAMIRSIRPRWPR